MPAKWGVSYDMLVFVSPPSALRAWNTDAQRRGWWRIVPDNVPVAPGQEVSLRFKARLRDVGEPPAYAVLYFFDAAGRRLDFRPDVVLGSGTAGWREVELAATAPEGAVRMGARLVDGPGTPERPALVWLDDLRVLVDGREVLRNDFTFWPGVAAVGAGGALGGYLGWRLGRRWWTGALGAALGVLGGWGLGALAAKGVRPV